MGDLNVAIYSRKEGSLLEDEMKSTQKERKISQSSFIDFKTPSVHLFNFSIVWCLTLDTNINGLVFTMLAMPVKLL